MNISGPGGRKAVLLLFIINIAVITFGGLWGQSKAVPKPSQYVGATIVFGVISLLAEVAPAPAAAFAGLVTLGTLVGGASTVKTALSGPPAAAPVSSRPGAAAGTVSNAGGAKK